MFATPVLPGVCDEHARGVSAAPKDPCPPSTVSDEREASRTSGGFKRLSGSRRLMRCQAHQGAVAAIETHNLERLDWAIGWVSGTESATGC
jgi:hypothetical protein